MYKKNQKEHPGNYRPVSLTSVLGSVMTQHKQDKQGIRPRQHGFRKGRSFLTDLIFSDEVTCVLNKGKAVDVVCLDCSKAFDTVSYSTFLEKLAAHALDCSLGKKLDRWPDPERGGT